MKPLLKEHKEMLLKIVNEWAFKAFILEYDWDENKAVRRIFKDSLGKDDYEYSDEDAKLMNSVREKWIDYHNGKYDHKIPENFLIKQSKL